MKKIVALTLSVLMCCAVLIACGKEEKVAKSYQDFEAAMGKTQELDSLSAKLDMDIKIFAEGMSMDVPMDMNIKIKDAKSEDPVVYVDLKMSMMGIEMAMEMYQEDGWGYYVSDGEKYKINLEEQESAEYTQNLEDLMQKLPEDIMKKADIESGKDGSATLTVELGEADFNNLFGDYMEGLGYGTEGATIKGASVSMTAKDGYLTVYKMNMEMEMNVEGAVTQASAEITATYDNPGKSVEITPPDGYKDFPEFSGDEF